MDNLPKIRKYIREFDYRVKHGSQIKRKGSNLLDNLPKLGNNSIEKMTEDNDLFSFFLGY